MNTLKMETAQTTDIVRLIKIDEVSLRLENLFYQLENRPNGKEVRIEEQIKYNKSLYHVLTGKHYVYPYSRRVAA